MRYLGFVLFIILLLPNTLSASSSYYVKVAQTKSAKELKRIKYKLNRIGVSTFHKTSRTAYTVYSGPYRDTVSANRALKKVKRRYKRASVFSIQNKKNKKKAKAKSFNKNKMFVGGAIGYSSVPLTHRGNIEIYLPNDTGLSYNLHTGYNLNSRMFLTADYMLSDAKDVVFNNLSVSANYKFGPYARVSPYFGLVAGYSQITWNRNPIDNSTEKGSNVTGSYLVGTQIGAIYNSSKAISLFMNYQCLFMAHNTNINTADVPPEATTLKHKDLTNLQFGVRYSF